MTSFLNYLLEVNLIFIALVVLYKLLFQKLSFHTLNRWLLIAFIPLSLIIPELKFGFIQINEHQFVEDSFFIDEASEQLVNANVSSATSWYENPFQILVYLYLLGASFYVLSVLWHVYRIVKLRYKSQLLIQKGYTVIASDTELTFSAFSWVFVPKHEDKPNAMVLKHEEAHVLLFHTLDLLITELFIAFSWFNPFVFLFRKQLKTVHEFQADQYVIGQNIKRSDYLTEMAKNLVSAKSLPLSSHFKSLSIKNRINMITKDKSSNAQGLRYLILAPLCALSIFLFSGFIGTKPSIFPIKEGDYKKITSGFGNRVDPISKKEKLHGGIDISAEIGTNIMATGSGTIITAKYDKNWGNRVIIDHGNGYQTWYAHMHDISVRKGDAVEAHDIIGHVGSTGRSKGAHLHYEVRLNGKRLNPTEFYSN